MFFDLGRFLAGDRCIFGPLTVYIKNSISGVASSPKEIPLGRTRRPIFSPPKKSYFLCGFLPGPQKGPVWIGHQNTAFFSVLGLVYNRTEVIQAVDAAKKVLSRKTVEKNADFAKKLNYIVFRAPKNDHFRIPVEPSIFVSRILHLDF